MAFKRSSWKEVGKGHSWKFLIGQIWLITMSRLPIKSRMYVANHVAHEAVQLCQLVCMGSSTDPTLSSYDGFLTHLRVTLLGPLKIESVHG